MTAQDIINIITTVGFPIVMCGALAWFVKYSYDRFNAMIDKINTHHDEETKGMIKSLDANTQAIAVLTESIRRNEM